MGQAADPLRIVCFEARNTKKLKAVTIRPDPEKPIVMLTGKNRQGKTSVIDSIWMALGGKSAIPAKPIRDGETDAMVALDLGQFVVIRRLTEKGEYLEVKTKEEGFTAPSPQTFLASRLGERASNPLEFMRLKPDEQVKALQKMINIKLDLAELERVSGLSTKGVKADDPVALLDTAYKHLYEKRGEANKEVTRLDGVVKTAAANIPAGKTETEPVSVTELFEKRKTLEGLAAANQAEEEKIQGIFKSFDQRMNEMTLLDRRIQETEALLLQLQNNRKALTLKIDVLDAEYQEQSDKIDTLVYPDFTEIDAAIAAADETNRIAGFVKQHRDSVLELEAQKTKSSDLTAKLAAVKELKGRLIIEAGLPVEGLGFENGEVTYNGIPLSQASTAEQIQISCAICMATHPGIGVLTIDVGWNELDSESKKVLVDWAVKTKSQIWVTRVTDEPDGEGFFIEDGMVTAIDGQAVAVEAEGGNGEGVDGKVKQAEQPFFLADPDKINVEDLEQMQPGTCVELADPSVLPDDNIPF